jgi:hypothetical protein
VSISWPRKGSACAAAGDIDAKVATTDNEAAIGRTAKILCDILFPSNIIIVATPQVSIEFSEVTGGGAIKLRMQPSQFCL